MSGLDALFAYTHIWHNAKMPSLFLLLAAKEIIYYTLDSLSVFLLVKNLQLTLELGMISRSNIKLFLATVCLSLISSKQCILKQLLDLKPIYFRNHLIILQSPWSYRWEVWCSPAGDEISNLSFSCILVRMRAQFCFVRVHYLFIWLTYTLSSLNDVLILLCVIFLTYMFCPWLCSHCGWLFLKSSAIGIGFNGAETNRGIADISGIRLMNSYDT